MDETYVINMDNKEERLKSFDSMMTSEHGIDGKQWKYIRMPAVNGKDLMSHITSNQYRTLDDMEEMPTIYRTCEDSLNLEHCIKTLLPNNINDLYQKCVKGANWLSPGEIGCLLSHVFLWERVANNPNLNRIIVFEDDARTHTDVVTVKKLICDLYEHMKNNGIEEPDMLYLGKALDACTRYENIWKNVYKSYHPLCLHAYLITKNGARKLLSRIPYDRPIDVIPIHAITDKIIQVMAFHPSLYFQDIINNSSSLRQLGNSLNVTTECLVDRQHMSDTDMRYISVVFIALFATIILYALYAFVWKH